MNAIALRRMRAQHLARPAASPLDVVRDLLAMQAQEYWGGLWAVGLRTKSATEATIESELAAGTILRTHPMRGTHHFVAASDMRWLMALMGPLMIRRNERRNRELELDEKTLRRALTAIERAIESGEHLTRADVASVLRRARIAPDGQRLPHIIHRAELEALVCSGRRKGKQITFASFDARVPSAAPRAREDSLADMARRYFASRGPATLDDFKWWCQLPAADCRSAVALAGDTIATETIDDKTYYFTAYSTARSDRARGPRALLLPPYDELTVAYADRSAVGAAPSHVTGFAAKSLLSANLVLNGRVIGTWKRSTTKRGLAIVLAPWEDVSRDDRAALTVAAGHFAEFVGQPPQISFAPW